MKITPMLSVTIVFTILLGLAGHVHAERGDAMSQQQELQKALEMMKKQGMDAKTQKQMENMFKNMSEEGAKQQSAKMKKEQQAFEAETANNGTVHVELAGKGYELKVIKCVVRERSRGLLSIHARQAPGKDSGELRVTGSSREGGYGCRGRRPRSAPGRRRSRRRSSGGPRPEAPPARAGCGRA